MAANTSQIPRLSLNWPTLTLFFSGANQVVHSHWKCVMQNVIADVISGKGAVLVDILKCFFALKMAAMQS